FECTETLVDRSCDEHEPAGGGDGAALSESAGIVNSFGFKFIARAERHTPDNVSCIGIHSYQLGPWRRLARQLCSWIPETRVKRSLPQRTEPAIRYLVAVLRLVQTAETGDIARIDENIA